MFILVISFLFMDWLFGGSLRLPACMCVCVVDERALLFLFFRICSFLGDYVDCFLLKILLLRRETFRQRGQSEQGRALDDQAAWPCLAARAVAPSPRRRARAKRPSGAANNCDAHLFPGNLATSPLCSVFGRGLRFTGGRFSARRSNV